MNNTLKIESTVIFLALVIVYYFHNFHWFVFVIFFFVPDISLIGYTAGPVIGAKVYNSFHNYVAPILLVIASGYFDYELGRSLAIIWAAHIALDRALGFGLKLTTGFKDTHLGKIGK